MRACQRFSVALRLDAADFNDDSTKKQSSCTVSIGYPTFSRPIPAIAQPNLMLRCGLAKLPFAAWAKLQRERTHQLWGPAAVTPMPISGLILSRKTNGNAEAHFYETHFLGPHHHQYLYPNEFGLSALQPTSLPANNRGVQSHDHYQESLFQIGSLRHYQLGPTPPGGRPCTHPRCRCPPYPTR